MALTSKAKNFCDDQSGMISVDGLLAAAVVAVIATSGANFSPAPSGAAYIDTDAQFTRASCGNGAISTTCG